MLNTNKKEIINTSLQLSIDIIRKVDAYSKENGIATRSAALRELIRMGLKEASR